MMYASEAAELLGKHPNFFAIMKCRQIEKYNHILKLKGTNLLEKYSAYLEEQETVLKAFAEEYYWLEDNRLLFEFSKLVSKSGMMNNGNSFINSASQVIFNGSGEFSGHTTYIKYTRILILLIKFKQKKEKING